MILVLTFSALLLERGLLQVVAKGAGGEFVQYSRTACMAVCCCRNGSPDPFLIAAERRHVTAVEVCLRS